jgi:hypothetical protein
MSRKALILAGGMAAAAAAFGFVPLASASDTHVAFRIVLGNPPIVVHSYPLCPPPPRVVYYPHVIYHHHYHNHHHWRHGYHHHHHVYGHEYKHDGAQAQDGHGGGRYYVRVRAASYGHGD